MRLLVDGELKPAGGIVGLGFDEFRWPRPVRPGDELYVESGILEVQPSMSRPDQGRIKVRTTTFNQNCEAVQIQIGNLLVLRKQAPKRTRVDAPSLPLPDQPAVSSGRECIATSARSFRHAARTHQHHAHACASLLESLAKASRSSSFMVWRRSWFGCGDPLRRGNRVPFDPDGAWTA